MKFYNTDVSAALSQSSWGFARRLSDSWHDAVGDVKSAVVNSSPNAWNRYSNEWRSTPSSRLKIRAIVLSETRVRSLKSSCVKSLLQISSTSACCFAVWNRCHPWGDRMTPRTRPTAALPFLDLDGLKSIGKSTAIKGRASLKPELWFWQVFECCTECLGKEYHGSPVVATPSKAMSWGKYVFRNRCL